MKIQRYVAFPKILCGRKAEVERIDFICNTVDVVERNAVKWKTQDGEGSDDLCVSNISIDEACLRRI